MAPSAVPHLVLVLGLFEVICAGAARAQLDVDGSATPAGAGGAGLRGKTAAKSDLACSLNGMLVGCKFKCDAPWTASNCTKLDIKPKKKGAL